MKNCKYNIHEFSQSDVYGKKRMTLAHNQSNEHIIHYYYKQDRYYMLKKTIKDRLNKELLFFPTPFNFINRSQHYRIKTEMKQRVDYISSCSSRVNIIFNLFSIYSFFTKLWSLISFEESDVRFFIEKSLTFLFQFF